MRVCVELFALFRERESVFDVLSARISCRACYVCRHWSYRPRVIRTIAGCRRWDVPITVSFASLYKTFLLDSEARNIFLEICTRINFI